MITLQSILVDLVSSKKSDNNLRNNSFMKDIIFLWHLTSFTDYYKPNRKFQGRRQTKLNNKLKLFCPDLILIMVRES